MVINHLNRFGVIELPLTGSDGANLVDTTNDRFLNATDALLVINYLNRRSLPAGANGEGEGSNDLEARGESEDSLVQWLAAPTTTESEGKPVIAKLIGPNGGMLPAGSRKLTYSVDRSLKTVVQSPPATEMGQSLQALIDAAIEELDFELDWELLQNEPLRA